MWDGPKILRRLFAWLFSSGKSPEAAAITDSAEMKEGQAMGFPEMTSSNYHSYFFMPPVWIGKEPTAKEIANNAPIELVISRMLSNHIRIYVHQDGVFMFDFTNWPDAAPVSIPAFDPAGGNKPPKAWDEAMQLAQDHHYKATSVMNAHLACMMTALSQTQGHGVYAVQFITPDSYFTTHWGGGVRTLTEIEMIKPKSAWGIGYVQTQDDADGRPRILVEEKTVRHSFELLEKILTSKVPDTVLLTTLIYRAVINIREHDFATALTLSWTVCEKMLRVVWGQYLDQKTEEIVGTDGQPAKTINSKRRETLDSNDYTASIVSEILDLAGAIPHQTYLELTKVRRARNKWLHETKAITSKMAFDAVHTAQRMFKEVTGIDLAVHPSVGHRI